MTCAQTSAASCIVTGGIYGSGRLATIAKTARKVGSVKGTIAAGRTGKLAPTELALLRAKHRLTLRMLVKITNQTGASTTLRTTISLVLR